MRILILTQPLRRNYGGLLQAYALQTVLKGLGHDVVTDREGVMEPMPFPNLIRHFLYYFVMRYIKGEKSYKPFAFLFSCRSKVFSLDQTRVSVHTQRFIETNISTICLFNENQNHALQQFDAIVVGSDQVWRPIYSYVPAYFLNFTKGMNLKRIAYAASFGVDHWQEWTPKLTQQCAEGAKGFDAISVREDSGVELCREYLGVEAIHLLDPTLLLEKEDYLQLIEEQDKLIKEKIMMCYVLDKSLEKRSIIQHVADRLNLTPLEVMPQEELTNETKDISKCIFPSVSEWITGFRDAEFVVTDSFHGTVFAIIFNRPFVTIANAHRGGARFTSLLRIFGLENRLISSIVEISENHFQPIDYNAVNEIKKEWQAKSFSFLKKHLTI